MEVILKILIKDNVKLQTFYLGGGKRSQLPEYMHLKQRVITEIRLLINKE